MGVEHFHNIVMNNLTIIKNPKRTYVDVKKVFHELNQTSSYHQIHLERLYEELTFYNSFNEFLLNLLQSFHEHREFLSPDEIMERYQMQSDNIYEHMNVLLPAQKKFMKEILNTDLNNDISLKMNLAFYLIENQMLLEIIRVLSEPTIFEFTSDYFLFNYQIHYDIIMNNIDFVHKKFFLEYNIYTLFN